MRLIISILFLLSGYSNYSQCDLELLSFNFQTGDIVVVVNNSFSCGLPPPTDNCSECVFQLEIGLTNGVDTLVPNSSNPLWSYLFYREQDFASYNNYGLSGDVLSFNVSDAFNSQIIINNGGGLTVQENWSEWYYNGLFCNGGGIYIRRINLEPSFFDIGYPDVNPSDNFLYVSGMCPCDTITVDVFTVDTLYINNDIFYTDTLYIDNSTIDTVSVDVYLIDTVFIESIVFDTVFIENYSIDTLWQTTYNTDTLYLNTYNTDTLYLNVYSIDTLYIESVVYQVEYVYETDTLFLTEYYVVTEYIDCDSGLPCEDTGGIIGLSCDNTSVFAPNAVTPNGDGVNDYWQVVVDDYCWEEIRVSVYNRWGEEVWFTSTINEKWVDVVDMSDGVYTYTIVAKKAMSDNVEIITFNGSLTVFH